MCVCMCLSVCLCVCVCVCVCVYMCVWRGGDNACEDSPSVLFYNNLYVLP